MDSAHLISLDNGDGTLRQVMVIQETIASNKGGVKLINTFKLHEGVDELGTITFNEDYTAWKYSGNLNRDDQYEIAKALERRYIDSEEGDFEDTQGFKFVANVNQDDVIVGIEHGQGGYQVWINGDYVGDIKLKDDGITWAMVDYELDKTLVKEIGRKIEVYYE